MCVIFGHLSVCVRIALFWYRLVLLSDFPYKLRCSWRRQAVQQRSQLRSNFMTEHFWYKLLHYELVNPIQNQSMCMSLLTLFRYLIMRRTATSHTAVGKCDAVCLVLIFLFLCVGLFWHISVCGHVGLFWYVWISFDIIEIPHYVARCNITHGRMEVWSYRSLLICVDLFWHYWNTSICGALQYLARPYGSVVV